MVSLCEYEAKEEIGGLRRHTKTRDGARYSSQGENYLCLVGLERADTLGNAWKEQNS